MRTSLTRLATAAAIATASLALAAPAWAHVTIQPPSATAGSFATLAVKVPNERPAPTTSVQIVFPENHPIAYVSVEPIPGWTTTVEKRTLATPIEAEGSKITEVVSSVTWSGGRIGEGEFQQFMISAGPLPTDTDSLEFKAIQTYENGEVVRWIEPTPKSGEEPERPAPVLELSEGSADDHHGGSSASDDASSSDSGTKTLAIASAAISVLAIAMAGGALLVGRKKS